MQDQTDIDFEASGIVRSALARLAELPDAQAVAASLTEQGIRGRQGTASACPIAVYLSRESGLPVVVGLGTWTVDRLGWEGVGDDLPEVVGEFVKVFDHGVFPRLIARAQGAS